MEKMRADVGLLILRKTWVDGRMVVTPFMAGLASLDHWHSILIALLQTVTTPVACQMGIMCGLQQNSQVKPVAAGESNDFMVVMNSFKYHYFTIYFHLTNSSTMLCHNLSFSVPKTVLSMSMPGNKKLICTFPCSFL